MVNSGGSAGKAVELTSGDLAWSSAGSDEEATPVRAADSLVALEHAGSSRFMTPSRNPALCKRQSKLPEGDVVGAQVDHVADEADVHPYEAPLPGQTG